MAGKPDEIGTHPHPPARSHTHPHAPTRTRTHPHTFAHAWWFVPPPAASLPHQVQGIELANPEATRQKKANDVAEKYFAQTATFVKVQR